MKEFLPLKFSIGPRPDGVPEVFSDPSCEQWQSSRCTLIVLGDFSGRTQNRSNDALLGRRVQWILPETISQVMGNLGTVVELSHAGQVYRHVIQSMDDFHPDRLLASVPWLADLWAMRTRLFEGATSESAARDLRKYFERHSGVALQEIPGVASVSSPTLAVNSEDENAIATLLRQPVRIAHVAAPGLVNRTQRLENFIQSVVGTGVGMSTVVGDAEELDRLVQVELSALLREVLRTVEFQRIEASWRGVDLLVRRGPGEGDCRIAIVDCSFDEVAADGNGFGLLLEENPGVSLIANFQVGSDILDFEKWTRIGARILENNCRLFVGGEPSLVGSPSFLTHSDPRYWKGEEDPIFAEWQKTRIKPEWRNTVISAPRFIVRSPYGPMGETVETFPFAELLSVAEMGSLLWCNSVFLRGLAVLMSCQDELEHTGRKISGLPWYVIKKGGESVPVPCAECWMSDRVAEALSQFGIAPVVSILNANAVNLFDSSSIGTL